MQLSNEWRATAVAIKDALATIKAEVADSSEIVCTWSRMLDAIRAIGNNESDYLAEVLALNLRHGRKACKGQLIFRATPPKDGDARLFHRAIMWHRGKTGGSLWGPMRDQLEYGADRVDRADTAACVMLAAIGQPLRAVDAWNRAIYG